MKGSGSAAALKAARRYAEALLELGQEKASVEAWGEQLQRVVSTWQSSEELRSALLGPDMLPEAKRSLLRSLGTKLQLSKDLVSTLCLLGDRGRLPILAEIAESYFELAEERAGLLRAEVTTASTLPPGYFEKLKKVLEDVTGKRVLIEKKENPDLLGGVVTRVGDRIYDGSLRRRLDNLGQHLANVDHL